MTATCQCGRPVDGAYLCSACTAALRATLEAVPDLAAELDITLTRQARFGDRAGGKSADKPLPYDVRASEATWVLRNTLTGWARVIDEEMGIPGPGSGLGAINGANGYPRQGADITTPQIALWLAGHVGQLRTHPAAGEAADEIDTAVTAARRAIDTPANRATIPIGHCPEPECHQPLTAHIPATNDRPAHITCTAGHTWDTLHWRSIGRRILANTA